MEAPLTSPSAATDWERCLAIAQARPSTLVKEARALALRKQEMFVPCYAAMRIIDDLIDHNHGGATAAVKAERLDQWRERALEAGRGIARDRGLEPEDAVFRALARALPEWPLGEQPWRALHRSMQRDLRQSPMPEWRDFFDYCEGATVAPTFVYLELLLARPSHGSLVSPLAEDAVWRRARPIGRFCYLVHIIRDHEKDAHAGPALLTVPETAYRRYFASLDALAHAWGRPDDDDGLAVLRAINQQARLIESEAVRAAAELALLMEETERRILERVLSHYRALRLELEAMLRIG